MLNFQLSCKRIFLSLFDAPHFELRRRFGSFSFLAWELFDFPFFLFSYYDNGMHEFLYENILNINKINISGTVTTNKAKKNFFVSDEKWGTTDEKKNYSRKNLINISFLLCLTMCHNWVFTDVKANDLIIIKSRGFFLFWYIFGPYTTSSSSLPSYIHLTWLTCFSFASFRFDSGLPFTLIFLPSSDYHLGTNMNETWA